MGCDEEVLNLRVHLGHKRLELIWRKETYAAIL